MRRRLLSSSLGLSVGLGFLTLALSAAAVLTAVACKVEQETPDPDGGGDYDANLGDTNPVADDVGPDPDGSVAHCTLDDGTDPVSLCTQKLVLQSMHNAAFSATKGVAESWSSTTGVPDSDGGVRLHDWHDDVAYAAAAALYHTSTNLYGDTQLTPTLDGDLLALAPFIEKELATIPAEYEGEAYQRLRVAAGGLNVINDTTDGTLINAIADKIGEQIYTKYFFRLAALPDAGAGDAGDAGAGDAGHDGGATDSGGQTEAGAGSDAGPPLVVEDGVLGLPGANGAYSYVTADVATGAYALLDLAVRYPTNANHANWERAAVSALDHIYNRARDPATGLYYTALVTSNDPDHDALDTTNPQAGDLLADTATTVGLVLSRAQDMANNQGAALSLVASYPFSEHVDSVLAALNGSQPLYDGPPLDAGAMSTGLLEGYVPATKTFITTKTTRSNAYAVAVLHRQESMVGTTYVTESAPMIETLVSPGPPSSSSLITCILGQDAYFRACTRGFGLPDAGGPPPPSSYQTEAVVTFVEGMSELLYGLPQLNP